MNCDSGSTQPTEDLLPVNLRAGGREMAAMDRLKRGVV
jgi:hypothetical protein